MKTSSRRLQDVLTDKKLLRFIMTKTGDRFVISLDLGYVQHHCNATGSFTYLHDVTECLKGDRILEIYFDYPQSGTIIEMLL